MQLLDTLRLSIDAGLCVLIWMVQLTVYPAFAHFSKESLVRWHRKYTFGISVIVAPLMIAQLLIVLIQIFETQNAYLIISAVLVILLWVTTFTLFVPLHKELEDTRFRESVPNKLVFRNWIRTALWTLLAILTITHYTLI